MHFSTLALIALLAIDPQLQQAPAPQPTSGSGGTRASTLVPTQEQMLQDRITSLEHSVVALQTDVKALKVHVHTVNMERGPSTYMSVHDLAAAMQPHSLTATTLYFIPLYLSNTGQQPGLSGIPRTTSVPVQGTP